MVWHLLWLVEDFGKRANRLLNQRKIEAVSIDTTWRLGEHSRDVVFNVQSSFGRLNRQDSKDFNSDVPEETAELWVGTPYAAWIDARPHQDSVSAAR